MALDDDRAEWDRWVTGNVKVEHVKSLTALSVAALSALLSGCGGIPDDYVEAFGIDAGVLGTNSCATILEPNVFPVLGGFVPGDEPIEFRSVEALDASFEPVEVYVMSTPAEETIGFGSSLTSLEQRSPALQAAWQNRASLPASAPSNTHADLVVVVPAPADANGVNYVNKFKIIVAVGDETRTFDWTSMQMVGSEQACEALRRELRD